MPWAKALAMCQSLVLSGALFALAGILAMGGILADLVAINRFLLEDLRTRALRAEIDENNSPHDSLK